MGSLAASRSVSVLALLGATSCFDGDLEAFAEVPTGEGGASAVTTTDTATGGGSAAVGGSDSTETDGASSTAQASGSGGTPGAALLVDDFEDEDTLASNGFGWWYAHNDGVGDQSLGISAISDRPGSAYAAHTSGVGFDMWGALLGLDFTPGDGNYDASSFQRIRFWAKASPDSVTLVSAQLLESDRHYGVELELSTSWQEYVLVFDQLSASEGGESRIDPSRLSAFQIFVLSGDRFDFWIDDVVLDTP